MAGKNFFVRTGLLIAVFLPGQTHGPVAGTVTTKDGQPISGVTVTAGRPYSPSHQQTTTNQLGQFRLDHAGPVIYFSKDKLEPKAVVVRSKQGAIHIILEPPSDNLVVPVCRETDAGRQRIGWGKYGLQFNVIMHDVEILGGKPDVDYVRYVIKAKTGGKGYLELWFGPYAINALPEDDLLIQSDTFAQRYVVLSDGARVGMDSRGQKHDGRSWRQTAISGKGGSIYRDLSPEESSFFDPIVNSACLIPYPTRRINLP